MNFDLDKAIEILARTPKIMKAFLWDLSEAWIHIDEGENTWTAYDVIGHLIHGEKTDWIPRTNIILSDKQDKKFEAFNRFAHFRTSKGKSMHDLLEEFEALRTENITYLRSLQLTEKEFLLTAMHPALGKVTLKQLLAAWVTHDLGHLAQIARVMAKHYTVDVGPWYEYMNILKNHL